MKLDYNKFTKILNKYKFFDSKSKVAVAVSGGPDSIALVMLLKHWIKEIRGDIIAIIINHNVRDHSHVEAKNVKKYLSKYNIQSKIISIRKIKKFQWIVYELKI